MPKVWLCRTTCQVTSYQSESEPVIMWVVKVSTHFFGQLLLVHKLLKDACTSYCMHLRVSKISNEFYHLHKSPDWTLFFFPLELNKLPGELEELTESKHAANTCVATPWNRMCLWDSLYDINNTVFCLRCLHYTFHVLNIAFHESFLATRSNC